MTFRSIRSRFSVRTFADVPMVWIVAGRVLLLLNAVILAFIPVTERLWTWDGFLRGGQDLELSLLALLAFFCLILVLAQHCRTSPASLFKARGRLLRRQLCSRRTLDGGAGVRNRQSTAPVFGTYRTLLQI